MSKRDKFVIPSIVEEKKKEEKNEAFVSPYSTTGKNEQSFPYAQYNNGGRQYEGLNGATNKEDDLIYYDKGNKEEKKRLSDEEKYNPDRIPSWLRREENTGINRSTISDLLGIKDEDRLEKERQEYGKRYQDAFAGVTRDNTKSIPNPEIIDPLNVKKKEEKKEEVKPTVNLFASLDKEEKEAVEDTLVEDNNNLDDDYSDNDEEYNDPFYSEDEYNEEDDEDFEEEEIEEEPQEVEVKKVVKEEPVVRETKEPREIRRKRDEVIDPNAGASIKFGDSKKKYRRPPLEILRHNNSSTTVDGSSVNYQISVINRTLVDFKIGGKVINYTRGPAVTQFEIKLDPGVNVNKISQITRNLQMNLESESIRIECPIPGKSTIGVEVPNIDKDLVLFGDLVSDNKFLNDGKPLNSILGLSIDGKPVYANISDMPHALIAGKTGSGKTVAIYSIIASILYKASPEEVKLVLIDPKRNEFIYFEDIPHLATPIIDESKLAVASLQWAVEEMDRRYDFLKANRKRTIADYNLYAKENGLRIIPYIVIVVDEFADLMAMASETFELNVQRLTQKARSAGIHLIIATQRPSTDVIKGTIKANIPTRIALAVQSPVDSMTVLDHSGAEKLLGHGDMLYTKGNHDIRIQGSYITETELDDLSTYFYEQDMVPNYIFTHEDLKNCIESESNNNGFDGDSDMEDELLEEVAHFVFFNHKASANQIQQTYKISFNRANRMINTLARLGIITPENIPGKARAVVINDIDELEQILNDR